MYQPKSEIPPRVTVLRYGTKVALMALPEDPEETMHPGDVYAWRLRNIQRAMIAGVAISLVAAWLLAAVLP